MYRPIDVVCMKIIDIVPIKETELIYRLKELVEFMPYCPPENYYNLWGRLGAIINNNIPYKSELSKLEEWQVNILKIYMGSNFDKLSEELKN